MAKHTELSTERLLLAPFRLFSITTRGDLTMVLRQRRLEDRLSRLQDQG